MTDNLISACATGDLIYIHSGITNTITDSFSTPGGSVGGLAIDSSGNLISCDDVANKVYVHSGITTTITDSFMSIGTLPSGLEIQVVTEGGISAIFRYLDTSSKFW